MSEQKVWVEKMPESCSKCLFCYDNRPYWKSTDCIINHKELDEDEIEISVNKNCPLQSIKDHDRELVKEVCEKIARNVRVRKIQEEWYAFETDLRAVLDQIQKEFER